MSTQNPNTEIRPLLYRFTVRQFEKMIDADLFPEGHWVELLAGVCVRMKATPVHGFALGSLADVFYRIKPEGYYIRQRKPGRAGKYWMAVPDIGVVRGQPRDCLPRSPELSRFALIIEAAEDTYDLDRSWKWRRYAASGVPVYGILDLNNQRLELFTQPTGRGRSARYEQVKTFGPEEEAPLPIDGTEIGRLLVKDVLP